MSNGDLANRTGWLITQLETLEPGSIPMSRVTEILREWLENAPLLGNLHRSRALVGRLLEDQKGMIGALSVGIDQTKRFPDDGPLQTFKQIAEKRIAESLKVP